MFASHAPDTCTPAPAGHLAPPTYESVVSLSVLLVIVDDWLRCPSGRRLELGSGSGAAGDGLVEDERPRQSAARRRLGS